MSIDSETLGLWESYKRMRESHDRDTAQAVRVEREAIATWLEGLAEGDVGDVILEHVLAIRSGEHLKGRS